MATMREGEARAETQAVQKGNRGAAVGVWWDDSLADQTEPIRCIPPRGCPYPWTCSRVGYCDRARVGESCRVTT